MGNDIVKKQRSDSQDNIREKNRIKELCTSFSKNKSTLNRNPFFIEKRKRFCELVKNQIYKKIPKNEEVDIFFNESRKIINSDRNSNNKINTMTSVDETNEELEDDMSHSMTKTNMNTANKDRMESNDKLSNIADRTTGLTEYKYDKLKLSLDNLSDSKENFTSHTDEKFMKKSLFSEENNIEKRKIIFDDCTNDKIRRKYYQSLLNRDLMQKSKEKNKFNNVFIFDWDDTIMCTTFITPTGYFTEKNLKEIEKKKDFKLFKELEDVIYKILTFALSQGDVFIITNAASGWVEYSTRVFFPNILNLLSRIIIISARGWFEKEFPRNSKMWKFSCFEELGKIYDPKIVTNLVVIGDSLIEMEAAYLLGKKFNVCYVKTIKLKDAPTPNQLLKQLKLLLKEIPNISEAHQTLSISIQKERTSIERLSRASKLNQFKSTNNILLFKEDRKTNTKIVTRDLKRFSVI